VQQIADWLEKLGMSEYAERFAENGIRARTRIFESRSGEGIPSVTQRE
jgi:SAM domain (Sterile alpha motif)